LVSRADLLAARRGIDTKNRVERSLHCCLLNGASEIKALKDVAYILQDGFDREFSIFGGELREMCGEANDEFGTGHADILRGLPVSNDARPVVDDLLSSRTVGDVAAGGEKPPATRLGGQPRRGPAEYSFKDGPFVWAYG
jgi:hypothetical protein